METLYLIVLTYIFQDIFHLETPGGGGYGCKRDDMDQDDCSSPIPKKRRTFIPTGSVAGYTSAQESA